MDVVRCILERVCLTKGSRHGILINDKFIHRPSCYLCRKILDFARTTIFF